MPRKKHNLQTPSSTTLGGGAVARWAKASLSSRISSLCCGPSSIPRLGRGRLCEKFRQLLAVGRWFPPVTLVSSTRKLISSSFHRLQIWPWLLTKLNLPHWALSPPTWIMIIAAGSIQTLHLCEVRGACKYANIFNREWGSDYSGSRYSSRTKIFLK